MMRVGFVGAGRMGAPMVARLAEAGHQVSALGRTLEKRQQITQLGARAVADVVEVADRSDVVVVCVFTDQQVHQICLHGDLLAAMTRGSVLVVHTTGSPRTAEAIAAHATGFGIDLLDAPVSGGPHDIAAGRLTLFIGGTDDGVQRARPVLASYADPLLHVGPTGAGQKVKLINNALFAAQIGLLCQASALASRLGVAESTLLDALTHGSASSQVLSLVAPGGSVAAFTDAVAEFVSKDVAVVRKIAAQLGTDLGVLDDAIDAAVTV